MSLTRHSLITQPRSGVKSVLTRGKSLVWLGRAGEACDGYDKWWSEHEKDRLMPLLMNNVALCLLRTAGNRGRAEAIMRGAFESSTSVESRNTIGDNIELLQSWTGEGGYSGKLLW